MKCQILFPGKNQKNITNLSSAELAQQVIKVEVQSRICSRRYSIFFHYYLFKTRPGISCKLSARQMINMKRKAFIISSEKQKKKI